MYQFPRRNYQCDSDMTTACLPALHACLVLVLVVGFAFSAFLLDGGAATHDC